MTEPPPDFRASHGHDHVRENVRGYPWPGCESSFFSSCDRASGHGGSFDHANPSPSPCHDGPCRSDAESDRGNVLYPFPCSHRGHGHVHGPCSSHGRSRARSGGVPCTPRGSERALCQSQRSRRGYGGRSTPTQNSYESHNRQIDIGQTRTTPFSFSMQRVASSTVDMVMKPNPRERPD